MKAKPASPRTVGDFLRELGEKDLTVKAWAIANGLDINATYMVIHGRMKGHRGEARRVVRAMGLPVPPEPTHSTHR